VLVVALLVGALVAPWWSETEDWSGQNLTQSFSPITGVSGTCSVSCSAILFPLSGQHSFATIGLNRTGTLYLVAWSLAAAALAFAALEIVAHLVLRRRGPSPRRDRVRSLLLVVAVAAVAAAAVLPPLLQPTMMAADTEAATTPGGNVWMPSPSPETSFWGGCSGSAHAGLCASGAQSAAWGPSAGWYLLVLAVILLTLLVVVSTRARPLGPVPPPIPPGPSPYPPGAGQWAPPPP
jgi:hypothetical protein